MKSNKSSSRTLIIAEVGVNYYGDLHLAKTLIKEAALAVASVTILKKFIQFPLLKEHNY
tara:strand:- start:553 stop:729 length:177 start_codon:yes stop_codon:yes gene_type:complete